MAYTQAGLPNGGITSRFEIHYDTSLSVARGMTIATELMNFCDSDYQWLKAYFPAVVVGPPGSRIRIWIDNTTDPSQFLTASWLGYGLIPYDINVNMGEMPVSGMRAVDAVRWLVIVEVSEMLMRERQGAGISNDWFALSDEGSKGEALSNVFGTEFVRKRLPGVKFLPSTSLSSAWLDEPGRPDFVSVNVDTIAFNPNTGCATVFLLFLHDQLGFSLDQIIANGSSTLDQVYHKLTGDAAGNAYTRFVDLVNLHYPQADGKYDPPLETAFPVPNLTGVHADTKLSWVPNGRPSRLLFAFDNPIVAQTTVHISSDDPNVVATPAKQRLTSSTASLSATLTVKPQPAGFTQKDVTLTASYAGRTMSKTVRVVRPDDLLPPLKIDAVSDSDRCKRLFEEGASVTFYVKNIDVFSDRHGLKYFWVVNGATANALGTPQITIPALPSAGTPVTVGVTVENNAGLRAKGQINIRVLRPLATLGELDRRVRCKISSMPAINAFIPPWIPIMEGPLSLEHIGIVQQRLRASLESIVEAQELLTRLEKGRREKASRH